MKLSFIIIALCCLACQVAAAETVKVTTRENAVRGECRFYAPVKLKVVLGETLTVRSRSGDWLLVSARGVNGCIHKSAVESRTFSTSGSGASSGNASADEVSLAGKGFNPQVESGYRKSSNKLNYSAVDEIISFKVNEKNLESFVVRGGLVKP